MSDCRQLTHNDKTTWRTIRKEFEDIGITIATFEVNRNIIFSWFFKAVETGAFEKQYR